MGFRGILWTIALGAVVASAAPPAPAAADDGTGQDVLAEVLAAQSERYASPPTSFRAGSVRAKHLNAKAVSPTENGFSVRFPSGAPITTPAVYRDVVIASGGFHSKEIYGFDRKNGKLAWALDLDDDGPSAPACADGICAFNTESCTLFVVDALTGKLRWSKWLGDPLTSAPAIANGIVYASYPVAEVSGKKPRPPNMSHAIAAFEMSTGKILWQRWLDADVMSSPVVKGSELWLSTFAGTVYKLNATSGTILSAHRARATSAPVVSGDKVLFSRRTDRGEHAEEAMVTSDSALKKGDVVARKRAEYLDAKTQQSSAMWQNGQQLDASNGFAGGAPAAAAPQKAIGNIGTGSVSTMQRHQGSRVLPLGGKNISAMGDEVVATEMLTGKKLWSMKLQGDLRKAGGFLAAPPAAAGKHLIVGTLQGEVLEVDPDNGRAVRRWKVGGPIRNQPIVQEGWIYVGTDDGRLVAIDSKDPSLSGWTQWGGNAARTGTL